MYHHDRSGLDLTMFRPYSSSLGRWLSRDPLGESAGSNLYAYVGNSPVNFVDPLGLVPPPASAYGNILTILKNADTAMNTSSNKFEVGGTFTVGPAGTCSKPTYGKPKSKTSVDIGKGGTDVFQIHEGFPAGGLTQYMDASYFGDFDASIKSGRRLWVRDYTDQNWLFDTTDVKGSNVHTYILNTNHFTGQPQLTDLGSSTNYTLRPK